MSVDATHVLHDGPWRHRFVPANGARFHVAECGPSAVSPGPGTGLAAHPSTDDAAPMVLLLHGFPQMWWCWRAQLPALAAAGYRAVAMDLRGYGASDKPPRGYDTPTLAADVAAVVRSLGASQAVVVGHDWGGWIAWAMPSLQPGVTKAIAALSIAHPLTFGRAYWRNRAQRRASGYLWPFQVPIRPERRLIRVGAMKAVLRRGSGTEWPESDPRSREVVRTYAEAMRVPFVAHSAMEYYRWLVRSAFRSDGRAFREAIDHPVTVPVLQLHGGRDPAILVETARASRRWAAGPYRWLEFPDAGHFLPEERPDEVTDALLDWLATLP
ncbi:MAG: alpha/beta fold hydrolase [Angustibacter sp.]